MNFYWVNIGATFKEVIEGAFLWAPESSVDQSGRVTQLSHWDNVAQVKSGDLIFCCHDQHITHIAEATANARKAPRPASRSFNGWDTKGHRINVKLTKLQRSVHRDDISTEFIARFDQRTIPPLFTKSATLKQIYMARLTRDAGLFLLEACSLVDRFENALIMQGGDADHLSKTTRSAIIQARIGQGKFRTDLMLEWHGKCSLTGLSHSDLLIASHIDAWSLCSNSERIDPNNGLLLAAHIDRLFDRGHISFANEGNLLIGGTLNAEDQHALGLNKFKKLRKITPGNQRYLARHRVRFGFE